MASIRKNNPKPPRSTTSFFFRTKYISSIEESVSMRAFENNYILEKRAIGPQKIFG
jgi:hypothetical protein